MTKLVFPVLLVAVSALLLSANGIQIGEIKESANRNDKSFTKDSSQSVSSSNRDERDSFDHSFGNDLMNSFNDLFDPWDFRRQQRPSQWSLRHFDPFRHYHSALDHLWNDLDRHLSALSTDDVMKGFSPLFNTDLMESDHDFHLQIDLPGIDIKDLDLSVEEIPRSHQKVLSIKAERQRENKEEKPLLDGQEENKKIEGNSSAESIKCIQDGNGVETCTETESPDSLPSVSNISGKKWIRQERMFGKVERTFILPEHADIENIKSKYSNGVLSISLPKLPMKPTTSKKSIHIETV
jgi:HSP20 family molecular chaperone IbpA